VTHGIRRIAPGDGPALREVRLAALTIDPLAFGSTHEREADQTDETWETWARAAAQGPDQSVFVAEITGGLVGVAGGFRMEPGPGAYHLFSMWVHPEHRDSGYGRALAGAVIDWAEAAGGTIISLWVTHGNAAAEQLYQNLGFRFTGAGQPLPHQPKITEHEMMRELRTEVSSSRPAVPAGYIEFAPMTRDEFDRRLPELIESYAQDLMQADDLSAGDALERSTMEVAGVLPHGHATPYQQICTMRAGLDDVPVGWIWFGASPHQDRTITFIYDLEVAVGHRNRGYGAAALDELEEWSRVQQHDAIGLHVFTHNSAARRFYERHGFVGVEEQPGHMMMHKQLG